MTTAEKGGHLDGVGPDTGLVRVLRFFERDAHCDASAAWKSFSARWNWAASLPTAVPVDGSGATLAARPVPGGFSLSGLWHLPPGARPGRWLALPLADVRQRTATAAEEGNPNVFVVSSEDLPRLVGDLGTSGGADASGTAFAPVDVYVPGGFATSLSGTPLRSEDAAFFWTAVSAMALGAAGRLTEGLAALDPEAESSGAHPTASVADAAAELSAALHDERLSLAATLHGALDPGAGAPAAADESLAARVHGVSRLVHHVVAAVLEYALSFRSSDTGHSLLSLIESSTPILQSVRFAVELLPPRDSASTTEGGTR